MRNKTRDCQGKHVYQVVLLESGRKTHMEKKENNKLWYNADFCVSFFFPGGFGLFLKPAFRQLFSCIFSNNSMPHSMLGTDQCAQVVVVLLQGPKPNTFPTCRFGDWYNDGSCSVTCGGGYQKQERTMEATRVKFGDLQIAGLIPVPTRKLTST